MAKGANTGTHRTRGSREEARIHFREKMDRRSMAPAFNAQDGVAAHYGVDQPWMDLLDVYILQQMRALSPGSSPNITHVISAASILSS